MKTKNPPFSINTHRKTPRGLGTYYKEIKPLIHQKTLRNLFNKTTLTLKTQTLEKKQDERN
jgi:hypothetical protein